MANEGKSEREKRLAEALRKNLRRRKEPRGESATPEKDGNKKDETR